MQHRTETIAGIFLIALIVFFIKCELPQEPVGPEQAKIGLVLKTSNSTSDISVTDTVGNTTSIGVTFNLINYIDSARINIKLGDSVEKSINVPLLRTEEDTLFFPVTFQTSGERMVIVTAHIRGQPNLEAKAIIRILSRFSGNLKPTLKVAGPRLIIAGETLNLIASASDPDSGQTVIITAAKKPANATFSNKILTWATTIADTGLYDLIFIGQDNGTIAMSDTESVFVTVSATAVNRPPEWYPDIIEYTRRPGTTLSLPLSSICTDPDKDTITYTLLPGTPARDTIIESTWSFTPIIEDTGNYKVFVVARDPSGTTDTLTINLTISQTAVYVDDQKPTMRVIAPYPDSQVISLPGYQIQVACTDESGIASVKWATGADTLQFTKVDDTLYTATVNGLLPSVWTTIHLVAVDASPAALRTLQDVHLKYDAAIPDTIKPVVTLVSPAVDTVVNVDSCVVKVRCTDESGVASVSIVAGTDTVKMVRGAANVFTETVKHLVGGQYTNFTITAVDSSAAHNSKSASVRIKYDDDVTGPTITLVTPVKDSVVTNSSSYTVTLKCVDASGVKSVNGVVKATSIAGVRDTAANWRISIGSLAANTYTMVIFTVTDSSLRANKTFDTLYIKSEITDGYTITYDKNDSAATGTMAIQTVSSGAATTLAANTYAKAGSTFAGWATSASGAIVYTDADAYTMGTANVTLYAKWTVISVYSLTYDGNTNTDGTAPATVTGIVTGTSVATAAAGTLTKTNYSFAGWNTVANGSGTAYAAGVNIIVTANTTLFAQWSALPTYSLTYDGNTNTDGTAPATVTGIVTGTSVATAAAGTLTKTNYSFAGWNTVANGSGTAYAAGVNIIVTANTTLFAQWSALPTYSLTYDGNTNTGGTAPATVTGIVTGTSVATAAAGTLTKTNYSFAGWNTVANGSGTAYAAGVNIIVTANTTLFAQWSALPTYSLTYDGNTNTGGTAPATVTGIVTGTSVATAAAGTLTKTNYSFAGWNTVANGSGTAYAAGVNIIVTANTTLFAQWSALPTYSLTYDGNTNTGGTAPATVTGIVTGTSVATAAAGTLTKTNYSFAGWNTVANGSGTAYAAGVNIIVTANTTLFAQWSALPTYSLTYDGNTNTGGTAPATVTGIVTGTSVATAAAGTLTKTNYSFAGWNTVANGSGTAYAAGVNIIVTANTTLFAQWSALPTYSLTYDGNTNTGGTAPATVTGIVTGTSVATAAAGTLTKSNYSFAGWNTVANGSGTSYAAGANITIIANTTLFAQWLLNTYSLTMSNDGHGTTTPAAGATTVNHGTSTPISASPATGYNFLNWTVPTGGNNAAIANVNYASTTVTLTGAATVRANFTRISCTVNYSSQGSIVSSESVYYNDHATAPSITNPSCSSLGGWYKEPTYSTQWNFTNDVVTQNMTLYVKWTQNGPYTVTFTSNNGDAPTTQTVNCGGTAHAPANPSRTCYTFGGWFLGSTQWNYNNVVGSDLELTAHWNPVQITITKQPEDGVWNFSMPPEVPDSFYVEVQPMNTSIHYTWYYATWDGTTYPCSEKSEYFSNWDRPKLFVNPLYTGAHKLTFWCVITTDCGNSEETRKATWTLSW